MTKTYAVGADSTLIGITEATKGVVPTTGYESLFFRPGADFDSERELGFDPLLGQGRDMTGIYYDPINVAGDMPIPIDVRAFGFWLHGLFGPAQVFDMQASGEFTFSAQPAADSTLTIGTTTWTFKTSGATGNETNIGGDLNATLTQLATDLSASADPQIEQCTYSADTATGRLLISFKIAGTGGNSFAIAASAQSNATASAATLLGGGYMHIFTSGGPTPSKTLEIGDPQLAQPRFYRYAMCGFDQLAFQMQRTGPANATINIRGQRQDPRASSTIDGSPKTYGLTRFSQGGGQIQLGGQQLAGVTAGNVQINNGISAVETIRPDGLIEDWIEGPVTGEGQVTVVSGTDTTIEDAVDAETPVSMIYSFSHPLRWSLSFHMPRSFLPKAKRPISDVGLITQDFGWRCEKDDTAGYTVRATLVNDVPSYV